VKWSDIPASAKLAALIVTYIMVMLGYLATYQTDAEAQAYQQKHQSELINFRVQQVEQRIQDYRYQLLSSKLSAEQREWIQAELKRLEEQKKCIRAGTC